MASQQARQIEVGRTSIRDLSSADEFVAALNFGTPPVLSNPESPLGAIFEDMAMALSKDKQRQVRPEQPTLAWKRVAERLRKKKT